jgi:hypothetical protein
MTPTLLPLKGMHGPINAPPTLCLMKLNSRTGKETPQQERNHTTTAPTTTPTTTQKNPRLCHHIHNSLWRTNRNGHQDLVTQNWHHKTSWTNSQTIWTLQQSLPTMPGSRWNTLSNLEQANPWSVWNCLSTSQPSCSWCQRALYQT